jgi:hypothetical protein
MCWLWSLQEFKQRGVLSEVDCGEGVQQEKSYAALLAQVHAVCKTLGERTPAAEGGTPPAGVVAGGGDGGTEAAAEALAEPEKVVAQDFLEQIKGAVISAIVSAGGPTPAAGIQAH